MLKRMKWGLGIILGMNIHSVVFGITESELRALEKVSFSVIVPETSSYVLKEPEIDLVGHLPRDKKVFRPTSLQETRAWLKQRLAVQINPKCQVGLDSFKVSSIDRPIVEWPTATQPRLSRVPSQKGYGVGIRMKLD